MPADASVHVLLIFAAAAPLQWKSVKMQLKNYSASKQKKNTKHNIKMLCTTTIAVSIKLKKQNRNKITVNICNEK